ncbi:DUF3265 domain-containing protein [Vibrio parahaemolyticus]|nr:DUF3265 domain-containing protein [Vibrio parahaemolyticus]
MTKSLWCKKHITNCLSVIQHAWHFYHAVFLVLKCPCIGLVIACFTP